MTISSLKISIEPLDMKYNELSTSPRCTNVSPGGACVVLNFKDNALKKYIHVTLCVLFDRSLSLTSNNPGSRRQKRCNFATNFYSNVDKCQPVGTREILLKRNSYRCRWCRSKRVGNTLPNVALKGLVFGGSE